MAVKKKVAHTFEDGREVIVPIPGEDDITIGMRRKTRHLKEGSEEFTGEMFFLMLEQWLSEDELAVWDNLTKSELSIAMEAADTLDALK